MKMIKTSLFILSIFILTNTFCQVPNNGLAKKELSETILQKRSLLIAGNFDGVMALRQLFPGKYYDLTKKGDTYTNKLISWTCSKCKPKKFNDVNETEGDQLFPYTEGVATRLINVMDLTDASGGQYKMIAFNHSVYDSDGFQTSRFTGGLLGLAKFAKTDSGWLLRSYQPAIAAYGAFANCPAPEPVLIGTDQYAFLLKHNNGGAGGPYNAAYFLLVGVDGSYKQQLAAYEAGQSNTSASHWESKLSVPKTDKKYFRDILITTNGVYVKSAEAGYPQALENLVKGIRSCSFSYNKRYVYSAAKGYEEKAATDVVLTNILK